MSGVWWDQRNGIFPDDETDVQCADSSYLTPVEEFEPGALISPSVGRGGASGSSPNRGSPSSLGSGCKNVNTMEVVLGRMFRKVAPSVCSTDGSGLSSSAGSSDVSSGVWSAVSGQPQRSSPTSAAGSGFVRICDLDPSMLAWKIRGRDLFEVLELLDIERCLSVISAPFLPPLLLVLLLLRDCF